MDGPTQELDRGFRRPGDPRCWGAVIGAVGGSVFVHANRGDLSTAVSVGAVVLWLGALVAFGWAVFVVRRHFPRPRPLPRSAGWVYLLSVVGMLALIHVGQTILRADDNEALAPGVVVLAVGLHFLPFARAFDTPMFTRLGLIMAGLGVVALVLGLVWTPTATAAVVVLTGLVMIVVITDDALRAGGAGFREVPAGRAAST